MNTWGDQRLRNNLIESFKKSVLQGGVEIVYVGTTGEHCIRTLLQALWYIDVNHQQFSDRSIHIFPNFFQPFR